MIQFVTRLFVLASAGADSKLFPAVMIAFSIAAMLDAAILETSF